MKKYIWCLVIGLIVFTACAKKSPAAKTKEEKLTEQLKKIAVFTPEEEKMAKKAEKKADIVARKWLKLLKKHDYAKSWDEMAGIIKAIVPQEKWIKKMEAIYTPLGKVKDRMLLSATYTPSVPGAPDGKYVVIQYSSEFENKKEATETITPMQDSTGVWVISGYYIK